MSTVDEIRIQFYGIGNAIANHKLTVPMYQRDYAWEITHIEELFADLGNAILKKEKEYFLGPVVVTQNETEHKLGAELQSEKERLEVVDGQQRLATISILLAAIRDYLLDRGDEERA